MTKTAQEQSANNKRRGLASLLAAMQRVLRSALNKSYIMLLNKKANLWAAVKLRFR